MKALRYDKKNKPHKFSYTDVSKPEPNENEIVLKIHAASVNAADYRVIKMGLIPKKKILGADFSGTVEAVGKNTRQFKVGEEVLGDLSGSGFGGFAEYATAPENVLVKKPKKMTFEEAAALPMAAVTALQGLRNKGKIKEGQKVLIVGSSGGVGTFAVQLAKYFGAIVTGVCGPKNLEQTKFLGADKVIDYSKQNFTKNSITYDLILVVHGSRPLSAYKRILRPNGSCVIIGGALNQVFKAVLFGRFLSLGSKKIRTLMAKPNQLDLQFIVKLVEGGQIKPIIARRYSLNQAAEAMRFVSEGHASGKVVIQVI